MLLKFDYDFQKATSEDRHPTEIDLDFFLISFT